DVGQADAGAVVGRPRDGLDRRAVTPVDFVGEAGGRIDRGRVGGGEFVGELLGGQAGGEAGQGRRWGDIGRIDRREIAHVEDRLHVRGRQGAVVEGRLV